VRNSVLLSVQITIQAIYGMIIFTSLIGLIPSKEVVIVAEATPEPVIECVGVECIKERVDYYAELYGVSKEVMHHIVKCESSYNPNALGDYGHSRGLVQIHSPSHPHLSYEQAYDIEFSLDFLAKNLSEGKGRMWTCYRMLGI
jgi:soluble lytic murein transglycosylase-like protein